ncbi:MAG: protease complex subunit PrcB family protein [Pyrinomonadaceae bacterium]
MEAFVFALAALITNGTSNAACSGGARSEEQSKNSAPASLEQSSGNAQSGAQMEIKILKEGAYASLADPFLLVVRDRETYLAARRSIKELPEVDAAFFREHMLVAAFLGSRNTGGYGVRITMENGVVKVRAKTPPADAMTTQAFTYPFAVASIKASDEQAPEIDFGQT